MCPRLYFLAFSLIAFPCSEVAAQDAFEDPSGRSSIVLQRGGLVNFNVTDSRLTISFLDEAAKLGSSRNLRAGIRVSAKATDGVASLLTSDDDGVSFSAETSARLSFGVQHLASPASPPPPGGHPLFVEDDWAGVEFGYERAEYNLIGEISSANPLDKEEYDGGVLRVHYNALINPATISPKLASTVLIGFAIGADRRNNYSLLEKATYTQEVTSFANGDTTRYVARTVKGRTGEYEAGWGGTLAADVVILPRALGGNIGVIGFVRVADHDFVKDPFTQGIGLVVTKEDEPTIAVGSVSITFVDGEVRAGLVAGFKLGG